MWEYIKNQLEELVKIRIPQKMTRRKDNPPWITSDIKKLIKKRDRLYKLKTKKRRKKSQNNLIMFNEQSREKSEEPIRSMPARL